MKTRSEHLQECKDTANQILKKGDRIGAMTSFQSDMLKHPETRDHIALPLMMQMAMIGNLDSPEQMGKFINDFN